LLEYPRLLKAPTAARSSYPAFLNIGFIVVDMNVVSAAPEPEIMPIPRPVKTAALPTLPGLLPILERKVLAIASPYPSTPSTPESIVK